MRRRTRWGAAIVGVTAMLVAAAPAGGGQVADPGPPEEVSSGWTVPWEIAWAPDGSFALVTERDDFRVWRIEADGSGRTEVGVVPESETTGGEGGLMGAAFSPGWNGADEGEVFFMHTSSDGNRVAKMTFDGSALSGYDVVVGDIQKNRFHNGGRIAFGPDGYLYVSTGDAQHGDLAQDKSSLNGKILRVTTTGEPAPDNPFGTAVYSYGHRNAQGLAFDADGRLWSSELGDSQLDELNLIEPGNNYGWPICEGPCDVDGMTNPKHTWSTAEASPSGLAFVNGALYLACLRGQRLYEITLDGENVGEVSDHWNGQFGRLRAVAAVPGANAILVGTTNADANGGLPDGSDRVLRATVG